MAGWKERVSTFCQYMCGVGDGVVVEASIIFQVILQLSQL